ncbi:MAG: hypothetical protein ABIJ59_03655 [Pseudomonadota bacterium]
MTHITQIISYSLICLLGLIIFAKSMYKCIKKSVPSQTRRFANPYITALAVGIIPCPGVVMVMLFAISLNLTWLGIVLGTFISIGMATTISCIVILGISGKSAVLSVTSNHKKLFAIIEPAIEIMAGLIIAGLGLFFLITLI